MADEVSSDESQALQALSNYWVTQIARNKDILKRAPPKNQQEEDFYNKYCDKEGKLSITAATHLMRYTVYRVNRGLTPLKLVIQMGFFYVPPLRYKSTSNQYWPIKPLRFLTTLPCDNYLYLLAIWSGLCACKG